MKRLSSFVLAVLLFLGTFVFFSATASADSVEISPKRLPGGSTEYLLLKWDGDPITYLLDVENNSTASGKRVIAYPYNSGGSANQQWDLGQATKNIFSPIYSNRDPGGGNLLGLSIDDTNKLVTLVFDPNDGIPKKARWKIVDGQLINQSLSEQGRNPTYVLTPFKESSMNNTALKFILPQPVVQATPSVVAPRS